MSPQYTRDELLQLRQSPLVCKPAGLPPAEEWMGSVPDPAQHQKENRNRTVSRGKNEEGSTSDISAARRPGTESRTKSGVNPEEIVLGPPRTSFVSAGRKSGNALDTSQRQAPTIQGEDGPKDRNGYNKDRFSREVARNERNGEQVRDARPGVRPRSEKTDSDLWSNARGNRTSGHEDQDRSFRRNGDGEFDRERRDNGRGDYGRDGARTTNGDGTERRGWQPKSRDQPSWSRDETLKDATEGDNSRPRGWREKEPRKENRGQDRHWERGGRQEMDPEWMDEPELEGKKQAFTADDFEQWKARMKAGSGNAQEPPMQSTRKQSLNDDDTFGDAASLVTNPVTGKDSKPILLDSGFDDFFGMGKKDSGPPAQQENGPQRNVSSTSGKGSKASKFSSLFTPAPEPAPVPEQAPPPPMPAPNNDSSDADKEGFARILSLLGGQQQPQVENGTPPRVKSRQKQSLSSPVHSPQPGMYNTDPLTGMLDQRSPPPVNQMPQNMDQQFLLGLMQQQQQQQQQQQKQQQQKQQPRPDAHAGSRRPFDGPGGLPFADMMISAQGRHQAQSHGAPPGFMQDAFRDDMPRDKLNPTTGGEQRRPPPGFAEMGYPSGMQHPSPQPPGFPPGMRPPGFDHFSAGQSQPQQPRQAQNMGPPPGFPPGMQRGQGPFPPGLMAGMQERGGQQFGMRPNGPGMPPPPPGFMGMTGRPPGFPNMPFAQEGPMPFGGGFPGEFGPGGPQQGFPGQGRR